MRSLHALVLAAALLAPAVVAQPAPAFPNLPDFDRPVDLTHAGDGSGRLFVAEQAGRVWTFSGTPGTSERTLFLDLSDRVFEVDAEGGLLSIAFAPDFWKKPFVYAYYVAGDAADPNGTRTSRVVRFAIDPANPNRADPATETLILEVAQPDFGHKGGKIVFGHDDMLYVPLGDGGSAEGLSANGQDRTTLLGKVLRLDILRPDVGREYSIPTDNPFAGNTDGIREEIWAWGVRNPWRASFDRANGDLWLGDVGETDFEEVNRITRGGNFGWDIREGETCHGPQEACDDPDLSAPVFSYPHSPEAGFSVTGGFVYRGPRAPSLDGQYVYGDFVTRRIWALDVSTPGVPQNTLLGEAPGFLATFGEDEAGELYAVPLFDGSIIRVADFVEATAAESPAPAGTSAPTLRLVGPNPFVDRTRLAFSLPAAGRARLAVFDVLGRQVALLFEGAVAAGGERAVAVDAARWAPGTYVVRLDTASGTARQRLTVGR